MISPELISETVKIFQPHCREILSEKDAIEIIENVAGLLMFLYELNLKHKGGEKDGKGSY